MLYFQTIEPNTLSILKQLLRNERLEKFYLAGGTALALQLGHRKSYDLDFFGNTELSSNDIAEVLRTYQNPTEISRTENIVIWSIDGVKVDFVKYKYPNIVEPYQSDGFRMLAIEDIAAMKLDAIKGRGRKRDFYDIYFLLKKFPLKELLSLHQLKYSDNSTFLVVKSLSYFQDAEDDPRIMTLDEDPGWEYIKNSITRIIAEFD
jgi:predicted nucleotidyltransferase component of viral defense system